MRTSNDRELERRVSEVLFYVWDPIGVSDQPYARGEYDGYVPQVLKRVLQDESIEPISEHLAGIVRSQMEMAPDKKQCDHTAELLLQHKQAVKEGLA
jgi:hypothetical protein